MKSRCRRDLPLFARYFFPDLCRLPWSRLHRYLFARRLTKGSQSPAHRQGGIDVILAPRGAAKSTLTSLIFPIHSLLYGLDHYIILISATQRQASVRLANIRDVMAGNPRLKEAFAAELRTWRRNSQRSLVVNQVKIDAFSAGSELRGVTHGGWRPTWIVLDDVESSSRILVSTYRDALNEWMQEVVENLGNGYTNIDLIGTLLHGDALPARLAQRPDVTARTFRSIVAEADEDAGLWEEWRSRLFDLANPDRMNDAHAFYEERREAMLKGSIVLWPAKEDYYQLQLMRAARGPSAFNKEKQNHPPSDEESVLPIAKCARFSLQGSKIIHQATSGVSAPQTTLDQLRIFGFLDPAIGDSEQKGKIQSGDFAAILTVGIDPHGYTYVLDAWLERVGPSTQIERIFDLHAQWGYHGFGIETNAFQKFLLEPLEREREQRRRDGKPWNVPVRSVRHRTAKRMRIAGLEPLIRNGWVMFSTDLGKEFMNQLSDFPHGRHDDGPDALQAALTLARNGAQEEVTQVTKLRTVRRLRDY